MPKPMNPDGTEKPIKTWTPAEKKQQIEGALKKAQTDIISTTQQSEFNTAMQYGKTMRSMNQQQRDTKQDLESRQQWNHFAEYMKHMKAEWNRGYNNDWISTVYSMMSLGEELGKAIASSKPLNYLLDKVDLLIGSGIGVLGAIKNQGLDFKMPDHNENLTTMLRDTYEQGKYTAPPAQVFANLADRVQLADDGTLNLDSLRFVTSSEGNPIFKFKQHPKAKEGQPEGGPIFDDKGRPELEDHFAPLYNAFEDSVKLAVSVWLDDLGYEPKANHPNQFVNKTTGVDLTKAEFDTLRVGLSDYLVDKLDPQFNVTQARRPN